jgi:pyruvate dehydrogenase E2 component (dihydrolipoamide acetyltransferase)
MELGVDLQRVTGTGPNGAVVREDVERAYRESPPAVGPAVTREPRDAGFEAPERDHVRVSPLARRAAEELGVDVGAVRGSGPGGAVTREDVEHAAAGTRGTGAPGAPALTSRDAAAASGPDAPGASARTPRDAAPAGDRQLAMRQAIAAAVARSKREIPHYYLSTRIDLQRALQWLEGENRERGVEERVLPAALLLNATALALREHPEMNGHWVDGEFRPGSAINPGVAIALRGGGLVAPALLGADALDLPSLMTALTDLVRRARAGGLRGSEMTEATITVTNLGDRGTGTVFGVIYPPQVAIVGFGRIAEEPWAENGMLAVRPVVHATLAADHRATDGHRGSLFLTSIDRLLQTPEEL